MVYTSHLSKVEYFKQIRIFFFIPIHAWGRQGEFTVFTELRVSDRKVMGTAIVIIAELTGSIVT